MTKMLAAAAKSILRMPKPYPQVTVLAGENVED